jgi:hypothetical protein
VKVRVRGGRGESKEWANYLLRGDGNTYGSKRRRAVLFGCEHQHSETERRSDEHLDEYRLGVIDIRGGDRASRGNKY